MENRINATISAEQKTKVLEALAVIKESLPLLQELDPKDYQSLPKMDNARYPFVKRALAMAQQNPNLKPQFYPLEEGLMDLATSEDLDTIAFPLASLNKMVEHTRALAGSEAYVAALAIYDTAKRGAKKGVEGMAVAYDELKVFFEGNGAKKAAEPDAKK